MQVEVGYNLSINLNVGDIKKLNVKHAGVNELRAF